MNKLKIANLQYQFRETRYRIDKLSQKPVRNETFEAYVPTQEINIDLVTSYYDMESEDL